MSKKISFTNLINCFFIGYALSAPISKAGISIFETLIFLFWILEGRWKEKWELIKHNRLSLTLIALVIINIVFLPRASSIEFGIDYLQKYKHFLIVLVMFTSLKRNYIPYIFSAFLFGMLISEITSYGIFFEWWHLKGVYPSDPAPFMSHIGYSIYLSLTSIILLLYILKSAIQTKEKILYAFFLTTVTINLFINGGRTGQLIYIISIFIVFIMSFKNKIKAFFFSLFFLSVVLYSAYELSPVFKERLNYAVKDISLMLYKHDYSNSFSKRVALWNMGYHQFLKSPLIGYGVGNDIKELQHFCKQLNYCYDDFKYFSDHHNNFITLALQFGIFGIAIIILLFYSLYSLSFESDFFKILNIVFTTSLLLWATSGIVLHIMNGMIYFTLFAGLLNKISYFETKKLKVPLQAKEKIKCI